MASSARSSGSASGLLYGWATTTVMFVNLHPVLTIPVPHLLTYVALAAIAGAVASALPARRAARASIVAAMAET
jgi:putative ABC transport system permease protein